MGEDSSGDVPNMDIGNSPRMAFILGLGEAEVADAIYANKTRAPPGAGSANRQALIGWARILFVNLG